MTKTTNDHPALRRAIAGHRVADAKRADAETAWHRAAAHYEGRLAVVRDRIRGLELDLASVVQERDEDAEVAARRTTLDQWQNAESSSAEYLKDHAVTARLNGELKGNVELDGYTVRTQSKKGVEIEDDAVLAASLAENAPKLLDHVMPRVVDKTKVRDLASSLTAQEVTGFKLTEVFTSTFTAGEKSDSAPSQPSSATLAT